MSSLTTSAPAAWDIQAVRSQFPILARKINGKPLTYLDSGASSQKPQPVLDALSAFYAHGYANIHRGLHRLSQEATQAYEDARADVARFINAAHSAECIFTRGTTEAINLVAASWGSQNVQAGDELLLTTMEHHANIVPWQLLAERSGAKIVVAPITPAGELDSDAFAALLNERTRLVAFTHISNALGTINPVERLVALVREKAPRAKVLVDGAQGIAHRQVDVQALGADWYAFSGHKIGAPTGIGLLWGRLDLLNAMPPYQSGGDMIERVSFSGTTFRHAPERFEAGTPHIAGAIGLGAATRFIEALGHANIEAHEQALLDYATTKLEQIDGLRIYGNAAQKASVISFVIDGLHPSDIGTLLDLDGVAIRTGHHCAMPLWEHYGITGTARASIAYYNTQADIDRLCDSLQKARKLLG